VESLYGTSERKPQILAEGDAGAESYKNRPGVADEKGLLPRSHASVQKRWRAYAKRVLESMERARVGWGGQGK